MALGDSTGHGHQYGLWWQYGPRTSTWIQVAAQIMDIHKAFSGNMDHWHLHSLWGQHRPWTSTWSPVGAQTTDINTAFGGNMDHGHPHGQYRPQMTSWPSVAAQANEHKYGLWQQYSRQTSTFSLTECFISSTLSLRLDILFYLLKSYFTITSPPILFYFNQFVGEAFSEHFILLPEPFILSFIPVRCFFKDSVSIKFYFHISNCFYYFIQLCVPVVFIQEFSHVLQVLWTYIQLLFWSPCLLYPLSCFSWRTVVAVFCKTNCLGYSCS